MQAFFNILISQRNSLPSFFSQAFSMFLVWLHCILFSLREMRGHLPFNICGECSMHSCFPTWASAELKKKNPIIREVLCVSPSGSSQTGWNRETNSVKNEVCSAPSRTRGQGLKLGRQTAAFKTITTLGRGVRQEWAKMPQSFPTNCKLPFSWFSTCLEVCLF